VFIERDGVEVRVGNELGLGVGVAVVFDVVVVIDVLDDRVVVLLVVFVTFTIHPATHAVASTAAVNTVTKRLLIYVTFIVETLEYIVLLVFI
jgi:hypothetical protein